jgi:hypothetical protein
MWIFFYGSTCPVFLIPGTDDGLKHAYFSARMYFLIFWQGIILPMKCKAYGLRYVGPSWKQLKCPYRAIYCTGEKWANNHT